MSLRSDAVGVRFASDVQEWTSKDAMLYAISVGAGAQSPEQELAFTTENSIGVEQAVLPTFATLFNATVPWDRIGSFPRTSILHGEQTLTLHETLDCEGAAIASVLVDAVEDKGAHAAVSFLTQLNDARDGRLIAEMRRVTILRGEGGFGGPSTPPVPWSLPSREPDHVVRYPTRTDQALLYRLNGDRHPLHSDPTFASNAGFDRPILHGLCTFGFAGRAILHTVCDSEVSRFGSINARFAAPVLPGAALDTYIWREGDEILFQTRVGDQVVLDRGTFLLRE